VRISAAVYWLRSLWQVVSLTKTQSMWMLRAELRPESSMLKPAACLRKLDDTFDVQDDVRSLRKEVL
jgi:hypothetical protein